MKEKVAEQLVARVKSGELIGIGTGSTVSIAIELLGQRIKKERLEVAAVPTSIQTAWLCESHGIRVLYSGFRGLISWGFDGADAVDANNWIVKGKGGALLQEKILAARCKEFVIIVDDSKIVTSLNNFPIPVEVVPTASALAERDLAALGATQITLRPATGKHGPIITEAGNLIYDAQFPRVSAELESEIKSITGVVDSGLFVGYASEIIIGSAKGIRSIPAQKVR